MRQCMVRMEDKWAHIAANTDSVLENERYGDLSNRANLLRGRQKDNMRVRLLFHPLFHNSNFKHNASLNIELYKQSFLIILIILPCIICRLALFAA